MITAHVDVKPFATYMGQLAVVLKQGMEQTIRMEAAACVRSAMKINPPKKLSVSYVKESARSRMFRSFPDGGGAINNGKKGGVRGRAFFIENGKASRLYDMAPNGFPPPINNQGTGRHLTDAQWADWKKSYAVAVAEAKRTAGSRLGARGLTSKSWFEVLVAIANGQDVPGYTDAIRRARPVSGASRPVGSAVANKTPASFSLTVENDSGITIKNNGQHRLDSAITRRRVFFVNSLKKGFYSDAKFVARYYPWAVVSET